MQSETYPEGLFGGERLANCADKPVRHEGRVVWVRTMLGGVFMIDTPEQPIPIAFRADCEGRKLPRVGQRSSLSPSSPLTAQFAAMLPWKQRGRCATSAQALSRSPRVPSLMHGGKTSGLSSLKRWQTRQERRQRETDSRTAMGSHVVSRRSSRICQARPQDSCQRKRRL